MEIWWSEWFGAWALGQVDPGSTPSGCGTWGTYLNLNVLICKRGAGLTGRLRGVNETTLGKGLVRANKDLHRYAFISVLLLQFFRAVSFGGHRCCPGHSAVSREWPHSLPAH